MVTNIQTGLYPGGGRPSASESAPGITDEALMEAYQHGDGSAVGRLAERYQDELRRFVVRFVDEDSADDVLQETFLHIYSAGNTFDVQRRFKPWMMTIARNKACDIHRKDKRRIGISQGVAAGLRRLRPAETDSLTAIEFAPARAPDEGWAGDEALRRHAMSKTMGEMPARLRAILMMSYVQGKTHRELATCLKLPLGTVKSRLQRSVIAFGELWKAEHPVDERE